MGSREGPHNGAVLSMAEWALRSTRALLFLTLDHTCTLGSPIHPAPFPRLQ